MNKHNIDEIVIGAKAEIGDLVSLRNMKDLKVVTCEKTGVLMLNIDADQLAPGDLTFIKRLGLTISNPDTDKPIALGVDYVENSWGHRVHEFLSKSRIENPSPSDDNDDSHFYGGPSGGLFGGGGFSSPSGGGFGGFGGGAFGGMGASRGF
ncbi:MAG: hypothetical protein PHS68_06615 [Candidatus Izemoplasmatales bacterium]|jgi:hypothetical protein|nr:hypothetical protein [Candidatus Izemoplasmatales bacterium]